MTYSLKPIISVIGSFIFDLFFNPVSFNNCGLFEFTFNSNDLEEIKMNQKNSCSTCGAIS